MARKPKARAAEVVIGALEERISMIEVTPDANDHLVRIMELFDELKRSLNGNRSEEEAAE